MHLSRNILLSTTTAVALGFSIACGGDNISSPSLSSASGAGSPSADSLGAVSSAAKAECDHPKSGWLFCDDFEKDRSSQYFEITSPQGSFNRTTSVGIGGSSAMKATFNPGQNDAGSLKLAFGKVPGGSGLRSVDGGNTIHREMYWRMYVKHDADWTGGGGDKLSRAQSIAASNWAQAMVAPIWSGNANNGSAVNYLLIDPATGIANNSLAETSYNDFPHQRYLGMVQGSTPLFAASHVGKWYCVEAHVKLNDPGSANGQFELWVNGQQQASRRDLDWMGSYSEYGINTVFFENYWNNGSPKKQSRYFDNIVVSTQRIGCVA